MPFDRRRCVDPGHFPLIRPVGRGQTVITARGPWCRRPNEVIEGCGSERIEMIHDSLHGRGSENAATGTAKYRSQG